MSLASEIHDLIGKLEESLHLHHGDSLPSDVQQSINTLRRATTAAGLAPEAPLADTPPAQQV